VEEAAQGCGEDARGVAAKLKEVAMPDLLSMTQEPLGVVAGWNPSTTYVVVIDVDKNISNKIIFEKTLDFKKDTQSLVGFEQSLGLITSARPTELLDLIVGDDCFIEIYLSKKLDWTWRPSNAITTSQPLDTIYFNLEYSVGGNWLPGPQANCQAIRFGAAKRSGSPGPRDSFNLNLILEYPGGDILPFTIDPDIQNPGVHP
jgi:hypothetical protein